MVKYFTKITACIISHSEQNVVSQIYLKLFVSCQIQLTDLIKSYANQIQFKCKKGVNVSSALCRGLAESQTLLKN